MTDPNIEQKLEAIEVNLSDLKSTVATLADIVQLNHEESIASRADAEADRAAIKEQAEADRTAMREGFERLEQQANADRALMLQLIQAIAQGRNGEDS